MKTSILPLACALLLGCTEEADPYVGYYGKTLAVGSITAGTNVITTTDQPINGKAMHIESAGLLFVQTESGATVRDDSSIAAVARMDGELDIFEDGIPQILSIAIDVRHTGTVGTDHEGWSGFAGRIGGTAVSGEVEPASGRLEFHGFYANGQNGIGIGPSASLRLDTLTVAP